jgi:hypothetical protein
MSKLTYILLSLVGAVSLHAQLDRATVTGVVTDPTGAVIPQVQITVRNTSTNASYPSSTNGSGQYTVPNLPIGPYVLTFEATGLKKLVREGVQLRVNDVLELDVQMEVGQVSDSVSVTAEISRIQNQNPGIGTNLSSKSLIDLPLSIAAARIPENFAYAIAPGVTGSAGTTRMDGASVHSNETLLDGESVTTLRGGHFAESSPSVEAVSEFRVQTTGATAEFGRTGGGVLNFVMKSGTNNIHGSAFGEIRNEDLNANTFINNSLGLGRAQDRRQNYAFSFGGPVYIPKVYNGRNKSFFYAAYERFRQRNLALGAPSKTGPIPAFYEGDFSRLLGPILPQKDALGRDVARGAIYDPSTFRQVDGGRWIGEMFPGNRIPVSRFSTVSNKLNKLAQAQYTPTIRDASGQIALVNNLQFPAVSDPVSDQYQFSIKGDQYVASAHRISGSYSMTLRPRWLIQRGMWDANDPKGGLLSQGGPQNIASYMGRLAHDWNISPKMLNYFGISFNRETQWSLSFDPNLDGAAALGIAGLHTNGYPTVNWGGGPFVSQDSVGNLNDRFDAWSSWGLRDTLSINAGRHFLKTGFDFRRNYMNYTTKPNSAFTFNALSTAIPNEVFSGNQTGYAFASYLLGIVYSGDNFTDSMVTGDHRYYYGLFVQDDFKVNSKLTLQLGLRWEYTPPLFESAYREASWSPTAIDPQSGLRGAYQFAGNCSACTGQGYFGVRDFNNFAPRVGVAYRPASRWTLRAAYGIFYDVDLPGLAQFGTSWLFPWIGTYPLSPSSTDPWRGVFNWDSGFPTNRYVPPKFDPSWGNTTAPSMVDPRYGISPYNQHWNFNIQTELPSHITLDLGYIGEKATKLRNGQLVRLDQMQPSALTQYGSNLSRTVRSAADAAAAGIPYPYPGFAGTVASALRPYPQVQGNSTIADTGAPEGFSTYHSLQVVLDKRLSRGLNVYANYVWSKALTNTNTSATARSSDQPVILDYYNRGLDKALSDADIPHAFKAYISYELPFGAGHRLGGTNRIARTALGGWSFSTILNYFSGSPLRFSASSPLSLWNGGTNRPNVLPGLLSNGFNNSAFDYAHASSPGSNLMLDKSKFSDPGTLRLGTGAPNYGQVRSFPVRNEDFALYKNTQIREKLRLQLRAEFIDAFNRSTLGGLVTAVNNPLFGQVTSISGNRQIQLGARVDF